MSVEWLVITRRNETAGLAFAETPEGEVTVHIRDARIPVFMEGNKVPFMGHHRLFLHSRNHLPRVGETVVALVRPAANSRRAFWAPLNIWEAACHRYEVVHVDSSGTTTVWQGDGILMLSLLFHSTTYNEGVIASSKSGFYRILDITGIPEEESAEDAPPKADPRLSHYRLPRDLIEDFPSWL